MNDFVLSCYGVRGHLFLLVTGTGRRMDLHMKIPSNTGIPEGRGYVLFSRTL